MTCLDDLMEQKLGQLYRPAGGTETNAEKLLRVHRLVLTDSEGTMNRDYLAALEEAGRRWDADQDADLSDLLDPIEEAIRRSREDARDTRLYEIRHFAMRDQIDAVLDNLRANTAAAAGGDDA